MSKHYPDMFYRFAFSGQAKCHKCKITVKKGQNVFVFQGNIYHDVCSQDLKGREKLEGIGQLVCSMLGIEKVERRLSDG